MVREHYIDQLTPEACALYLFLVTVADAQGLSYDADASLGQRLSLSAPRLHQARQALVRQGLVAYRRPLYQVLALGVPETTPANDPTAEDHAVDIKAVFNQIWEVLS